MFDNAEETTRRRLARVRGNGIYLHYRDLVDLGACEEREKFKRVFGSRVLVTVTTAVAAAQSHQFHWMWICQMALNGEASNKLIRRARALYGEDFCTCPDCDPDKERTRFIAQCFAEAFIAQGGIKGRVP